MSNLSLASLLPISLVLAACDSLPGVHDATETADADEQEEEKEAPQEQISKAERALRYACIELSIAQAEGDSSKRKGAEAVALAERELAEARAALDHFRSQELVSEMSMLALELDEASWEVEAKKQELAELKAMYEKDDVATLTKELVLQRGEKALEFAERDLADDKLEAERKRSFEWPKRDRDLDAEVRKAANALLDARAEADKSELEVFLSVQKACDAVREAEGALARMRKRSAKAQS